MGPSSMSGREMKTVQEACMRVHVVGRCLVSLVVLSWAAGLAPRAARGQEHQPVGSFVEIQGQPDRDAQDDVLMYRFWFTSAEAGTVLVAENQSDREGLLVVVQAMPGWSGQTVAKKLISPGSNLAVTLDEGFLAPGTYVLVKAPRRLGLAVAQRSQPGASLRIRPNPAAVVYDIFSPARGVEAEQEAQRELNQAVRTRRRVVRPLVELETASEHAAPTRKEPRRATVHDAGGLLISYWAK